MDKTTQNTSDGFKLIAQVHHLRSDQRGSITLLAGMMVFLVSIFGIIAFDTNMAIYNRIIAQNAADSAADSAALWQARGCNLLQELNNLHYDVDIAGCVLEGVSSFACVTAVALLALEAVPIIGEAAAVALPIVCIACDLLPVEDVAQHGFYDALMPLQQGIVDATPFLAFANANANAAGCGADNLLTVAPAYLQSVGSAIGQAIPALSSVTTMFSSVLGAIGGALGSTGITIYAMPLDPTSLELYVKKTDNDGSPPLNWPTIVPEIGNAAGMIGCEEDDYSGIEDSVHNNSEGDSRDNSDGYHPTWGWNDQYFKGYPGFMTWVAGKTNRDELLGFGDMKWLNGGMLNSDYNANGAAVSKLMYTGGNTASGTHTKLQIPAFIAIASSQVQGTPVICHGDVDARGTLIKVYFPGGSSPTPGENFFIYH